MPDVLFVMNDDELLDGLFELFFMFFGKLKGIFMILVQNEWRSTLLQKYLNHGFGSLYICFLGASDDFMDAGVSYFMRKFYPIFSVEC